MNFFRKALCMFLICIIGVAYNVSFVEAAPTCIALKFTDETKYSDLSTASLLSDLLMETLINERQFVFKEAGIIDPDIMSRLYDKDYKKIKLFNECHNVNNYDELFNSSDFGQDTDRIVISKAKEGEIVSPDAINELAQKYGVNHVLQGTITRIVGTQGSGNYILPALNKLLGETKYIIVEADIRLIDCKDGKVVWGKHVVGQAEKWSGELSDIQIGSKHPDSAMYYNACNAVAKNFMKELNEALIGGKFKFKY